MVNAGVLWSDPQALGHGQANHAVTITGIARDRYDGALLGLYINDSGTGQSGQFVSAHLMTTAFEHEGGFCVVTDSAQAAGLAGRAQDRADRAGSSSRPGCSGLSSW